MIAPASADFNPMKVKAYGPGLNKKGVMPNKWAEFTVDTKEAGIAPLHVTCLDVNCNPLEVQVMDNRDGTFGCRYMPKKPERHTVFVTYGSANIPDSPFRVSEIN